MIQFNLLPDVKIEYVKAQRTKRLVIACAVIATAASLTLFLMLLVVVQGVQKKSISDLNGDIKEYSDELRSTSDLNKILTIQHQLSSLGSLHENKVAATRIFSLMQAVTPAQVTISDHSVDFTANTMTITGQAPALDRVNTFMDTLKFTTFSKGEDTDTNAKAFSNVVLAQFGRDEEGSTYAVTLSFDPVLFNNQEDVKFSVPQTVTTRSVLEQPSEIFKRTSIEPTNVLGMLSR